MTPPGFKLKFGCPNCFETFKAINRHWSSCQRKRVDVDEDGFTAQLRLNTKRLMKNVVVDYGDLEKIAAIANANDRLAALIRMFEDAGHLIKMRIDKASDRSIEEDSIWPRKRRKIENDSALRRSLAAVDRTASTSSGEELTPAVDDVFPDRNSSNMINESARVFDSTSHVTFSRLDSVIAQTQEKGLYQQFNLGHPFFERMIDWATRQGRAKKIAKRQISIISSFLCYSFKSKKLDPSALDDVESIFKVIRKKCVKNYLAEVESCGGKGETIRMRERAFKLLFNYLDFKFGNEIRESGYRDNFEKVVLWLQNRKRSTLTVIENERAQKRAEELRSSKLLSLVEVWALFDADSTKELLVSAKESLRIGAIKRDRYNFIVKYCVSILLLKFGLRPETAQNLRLCEWAQRTVHVGGVVTLTVRNNKRLIYDRYQPVVLTAEDSKMFKFYFKHCRQAVDRVDDEELDSSEKPFFISFKSKSEISKAGKLAASFLKMVGAEWHFTSVQVRKAIETKADRVFADDEATRKAIAFLLGHENLRVIRNHYIQRSPDELLIALDAIKRLASEDDPIDRDVFHSTAVDGFGDVEEHFGELSEIHGDFQELNSEDENGQEENGRKKIDKSAGTPSSRRHADRSPMISRTYTDDEKLELINSQKWPGLEIRHRLPGRNRGVFATTKFVYGQLVCDYNGDVVDAKEHAEYMEKLRTTDPDLYEKIKIYELEPRDARGPPIDFIILGHHENDSFGRLVNHSRAHPNVRPVFRKFTTGAKRRNCKIHEAVFFVVTQISGLKAGEELLWDYGSEWNDAEWYAHCPCARDKCKEDYESWLQS